MMRKIFIAVPAVILFVMGLSSCSLYQVGQISNAYKEPDSSDGTFKFENDTLTVVYNFSGLKAPVQIKLENKLGEPLFVDWNSSAIISNGNAVSYNGNNASFDATITGESFRYDKNYSVSEGNINGALSLPKGVNFIPPHSYIQQNQIYLVASSVEGVSDSQFHKILLLNTQNSYEPFHAKKAEFVPENSPLSFISYLTLYTKDSDNKKHIFVLQHKFYLSSLIKMNADPEKTPEISFKKGNFFYVGQTQ